jgi:hypothetical protein
LAPVALVGVAGLAACGDGSDSDVSARTAAAPEIAVGSDVHLGNMANAAEGRALSGHTSNEVLARVALASGSDVHLTNLASDIAASASAASGSDVHLANMAADPALRGTVSSGEAYRATSAAEAAEREAHVSGNTTTYGQDDGTDDAGNDDDFVPGTRRMPVD